MFPCVNLVVSLQTIIQDRRGREERDVIYDCHLETRATNPPSSQVHDLTITERHQVTGISSKKRNTIYLVTLWNITFYPQFLLLITPLIKYKIKTEIYFSYGLEKNIEEILKSVQNCFNTSSAKTFLSGSFLYFFRQKVFKVI